MSTTHAPTLYPKITQHVTEVVKNLKKLESEPNSVQGEVTLKPIPIIGFVKLHGTHADILVYNNDKIILQSKNVSGLTASNDNHGFAVAMANRTVSILELRDLLITRWRTLNPDTPLQTEPPVLIAGEWIGTNIQKDIAISQLSPRFVIVSVNINNSWVPDAQYSDIEAPSDSMYNISRGGTFSAILDPSNIAHIVAEVELRAEEVASSCPFAASLGINGEGEGIVWKPVPASMNLNPALWFKTKGGRFRPTFAPAPKAVPVDLQEKRDAADAVAKVWCTQERLWQGWEFLKEIGTGRDMKGLGKYLQWVQNDVLTEERGYIEDHGVDKVMLRIGIAKIAKAWYIERVGEERKGVSSISGVHKSLGAICRHPSSHHGQFHTQLLQTQDNSKMPTRKRVACEPPAVRETKRQKNHQSLDLETVAAAVDLTSLNSTASPLLRLPAELRNQIWHLVFGDKMLRVSNIECRDYTGKQDRLLYAVFDSVSHKSPVDSSISRAPEPVCRQYWAETSHIFLTSCVLRVDWPSALEAFVQLGGPVIYRIRRLMIHTTNLDFPGLWRNVLNSSYVGRLTSLEGVNFSGDIIYRGPLGPHLKEDVMCGHYWRKCKMPEIIRAFQQHKLREELTTVTIKLSPYRQFQGLNVDSINEAIRKNLLHHCPRRVSERNISFASGGFKRPGKGPTALCQLR